MSDEILVIIPRKATYIKQVHVAVYLVIATKFLTSKASSDRVMSNSSYPESFFTPFSNSCTNNGGKLILSKPTSTWPGITPESTRALEEVLQKNYEGYHVFSDPAIGFHKYAVSQNCISYNKKVLTKIAILPISWYALGL